MPLTAMFQTPVIVMLCPTFNVFPPKQFSNTGSFRNLLVPLLASILACPHVTQTVTAFCLRTEHCTWFKKQQKISEI